MDTKAELKLSGNSSDYFLFLPAMTQEIGDITNSIYDYKRA